VIQGDERDPLTGGKAGVIGKLGERIGTQPQDAAVVQFHFDARGTFRAQPGQLAQRQVAARGLPIVGSLKLHLDGAVEVADPGVTRLPGGQSDRQQPQGQAFHESSGLSTQLTQSGPQAFRGSKRI
jgi:hypothetical protein